MEKTIMIDDKAVRFRSSGATALRYKMQFNKDFLAEILKLNSLQKLNFQEAAPSDFNSIDFEVFYNISWTLAKTADPSIPDPLTWLDTFDTFPLLDILPELQELITSSIQAKKK